MVTAGGRREFLAGPGDRQAIHRSAAPSAALPSRFLQLPARPRGGDQPHQFPDAQFWNHRLRRRDGRGHHYPQPPDSPNTDGIDPGGGSRRILISHCRIDTGDDDVCLKAASGTCWSPTARFFTAMGFRSAAMSTASGISPCGVALLRHRDRHPDQIQSDPGGIAENLVYEDLTMRNVSAAITSTATTKERRSTPRHWIAHIPAGPVTPQTLNGAIS